MNIQASDILIVIPVHKAQLTAEEQLSVSQCERVLGRYTIRFVCPESIPVIQGFEHIPVEHFENVFFNGLAGYNRLMMSESFYARFAQYTYLLIYQPDAFVFRDELLQWAQTGYPYIGAPWILKSKYRTWWGRLFLRLRNFRYRLKGQPFRSFALGDKIGNGGFSLRKIDEFLRLCRSESKTIQSHLQKSEQWSEYNEDAFWATRPNWLYPAAEDALRFSFDIQPQECLRQAQGALPFGCHGWHKAKVRDFWQPIINKQLGIEPLRVYFDYQAFIHQSFGGVSRYFTEIIARLPKYNILPIVGVPYSNNTHLQALGIPVQPVSHRKIAKRLNRRYCRQQLREGQFDIIHATYFDPYVIAANTHHRPLVITIHDMIDEIMHEGHHTPRRKALLAREATHIIAVSNNTKQDIIRLLGMDAHKISVVYHGNSIVETEPQKTPVLPDQYILYVGGRQRQYKNFRLFLQAMQPIVQSEQIDIICIGQPFTPAEQQTLRELGIEKSTHSLFADDDQLYTIYHHAQCFVYPSCYEGFGLPILEAWYAECPLILSRSSCFPEVAGDAAQYFEENNAADLTKQTLQVLHSATLRDELIAKGKARLLNYSWDQAADQTAAIYHEIYRRYV